MSQEGLSLEHMPIMDIRLGIRGTKIIRSWFSRSYHKPSNDEKKARQRGPYPYKHDEMVPIMAPYSHDLTESGSSHSPDT